MERVAESEIVPNQRIFVSIVGPEIEEKVEEYSQSIYYNLSLKLIYPQRKWISKTRWQEVERVDESEIFPNQNVLVSIFGREIEETVPLKPLILTPPAKIVNDCLPLGFHRQFFCVRVPDIIRKLKKYCQSEQDDDQVLYSAMDG